MHIHQYTLSQDSKNHLVNEHFFCARGICEVFKFYHIIHIHLKKKYVLFQVHAITCKCSCRVSSVAIIVKIKCQTPISSQNNGNR